MFRKIGVVFLLIMSFFLTVKPTYADRDCSSLGTSDYNTFKESCYKITDAYLDLRNKYEVNGKIDQYYSARILNHAKEGLNYLPNNLNNKNYFNHLKTSLERAIKYPEDTSSFQDIQKSIENFLNKTTILQIEGKIDVYPESGNAPLNVTLRGDVKDPTGTKIENYNYTWWILDGSRKKVIGNRRFMNYTFREEGNYAVFLDVTSNHRNDKGKPDVLSFSQKKTITVKEKLASTIVRVNQKSLGSDDQIKFTPEEGAYGLLIDASSSTPSSGTKFTRTEWDFGNGVVRKYDGPPKLERVTYAVEGDFKVKLIMKTNSGREIERKFTIIVRNPIASIKSTSFDGFLGDKFTFSANTYGKKDNLTYAWEIIDLRLDKVVFNKSASVFTYNFPAKGRFNVKLSVTSPSGETDYDNRIVYINSRAPVAQFVHSIPNTSQPNRVFFDGGSSYDLDFGDDGKLEYNWLINGARVKLENPSADGSSGYYTFTNLGAHSVVLEVIDPDDISAQSIKKVTISSVLGVDFVMFPRVTQVGSLVKLVSESPKAKFFEWNLGDGTIVGGKDATISHKYKQAGVYDVTLTVRDKDDNKNSIIKKIYVGDADAPFAFLDISNDSKNSFVFDTSACNGKGAYIVDRVSNVNFSAKESVDVTGLTTGLDYSWKLGGKYYQSGNFTRRFNELGCFDINLKVRSKKTGKSSEKKATIEVRNIKPTLSSLDIQVKDINTDPVIVTVKAVGDKDPDGVIQSYLWYYYTDNISDPQDFRATKSNSTTFVLPKVSGNYYFVVIMKDNNEAVVKSETITSRYFITLSGDNQNTPIISMKADNTSVSVGEKVTFMVSAKNIMDQNIAKNSRFFWDFDGDGFYDKETKDSTVTHTYNKAGEDIKAKVKVTHKGFSNTRTVLVNVSNILKPDFDYVSVGNDFLFFDKSSGSISNYFWDMGDGNTINKSGSFRYTYKDGKTSHLVRLKIESAGDVKETSKKVVRDFGNFIKYRKADISIFGESDIQKDTITLKDTTEKLTLYIKSKLENVAHYIIDYDINIDSDMNGGNEDDVDNKNKQSYYSGGMTDIPLNNSKKQTIKISITDKAGKLLGTKYVHIVKEYIKKEQIDPSTITFEGIPDSLKQKFEELKTLIVGLPDQHRLKGLEYIQKLKEEWNDQRAQINIILEFEGFIAETKVANANDIINLLESMLVKSDEKNNSQTILLNSLKNLIPKTISCSDALKKELKEGQSCYSLLTSKLDAISKSSDTESKKKLGNAILKVISADNVMTNKEKVDFKAILKNFIYGGLNKIPKKDVEEVKNNTKDVKTTASGGFIDTLLWLLKILFFIIIGVGLIVLVFYFVYKFINKNKDKSFTEFISDKTSSKTEIKEEVNDILDDTEQEVFDPLSDFNTTTENTEPAKEATTPTKTEPSDVPDWLSGKDESKQEEKEINPFAVETEKKEVNTDEVPDWLKGKEQVEEQNKEPAVIPDTSVKPEIEDQQKPTKTNKDDVPDWLQGSFTEEDTTAVETETKDEQQPKDDLQVSKQDEELIIKSGIPDWLKGDLDENQTTSSEQETKTEDTKTDTKNADNDITKTPTTDTQEEKTETTDKSEAKTVASNTPLKETKIEEKEVKTTKKSENIASEEKQPKKQTKKTTNKKPSNTTKKEENTKQELDKLTSLRDEKADDDIPDWLKDSVAETKNKSKEPEKQPTETKTEKKPPTSTSSNTKKTKKQTQEKTAKNTQKKEDTTKKSPSSEKNTKENELWDDGMKIPDWLKTDDTK